MSIEASYPVKLKTIIARIHFGSSLNGVHSGNKTGSAGWETLPHNPCNVSPQQVSHRQAVSEDWEMLEHVAKKYAATIYIMSFIRLHCQPLVR